MKNRPSPAVFLDRDGTLLTERGYLSDPARIHFYPGVFGSLRKLEREKFKLVVLTNQSGVGRGYFSLRALERVNRAFLKKLSSNRVRIAGLYFCPHRPNAGCPCRKPKPGMPRRAARELHLDLKRSFVIGDQASDMRLAKKIGAKSVLVLTGAGPSSRKTAGRLATKVVRDLKKAALWICHEKKNTRP